MEYKPNKPRHTYGLPGGNMTDKYNDPIHLRPDEDDAFIMDAISKYISRVMLVKSGPSIIIRHALRFWWDENLKKRTIAFDRLPSEEED